MAFLNGELEEKIYMNQLDRFIAQGQEGKVCRLLKSLYGLKLAPKQWDEKFEKTLTSSRFACVLPLWWGQRSNPVLVC